jgi:Phage portal protein, SPP1 Gp6-like
MEESELQRWRAAAERHLDVQAARAARYQAYFDGEEAIPVILDTTERQAFAAFLREAGANWCELVANAVAERLQVTGFRFAGDGGEAAWAIWQANSMDADAELVQSDALVCGSSFVLVQPDPDNPAGVEMTAESPLEATVLYEPGSRRRRAAGYKRFGGAEFGRKTEVLMLPDVIATWPADGTGPAVQAPNPAGAVGMIEVTPQPRTYGPPRSELHSCIPIQDRINTVLFARLVATDYSAFRQIWATGVKIARNTVLSADGSEITRPVSPYDVGANRLLANENPDGRFGSFPESQLRGYLDSVEQDVNQMAAITQTPPHYLLGQIANLSADAIKAAEAGLVAKCRRRSLHIGESWEEVARYALRLIGSPAAADLAGEVIWADFETRSIAQLADALSKLGAPPISVPQEVLWEKFGATRAEIERWRVLRAAEQAEAMANAVAGLGGPDSAYARLLAGGGASGQAGQLWPLAGLWAMRTGRVWAGRWAGSWRGSPRCGSCCGIRPGRCTRRGSRVRSPRRGPPAPRSSPRTRRPGGSSRSPCYRAGGAARTRSPPGWSAPRPRAGRCGR